MNGSRPSGRTLWPTAAVLVCVAAAALRLWHLDSRPMHADEAVQGIKFGRLLEEGTYRYDPHEFHGPTLGYFTLPVAWLAGARRIDQVTEIHLRLVPAVLGTLLVVLVSSASGRLGRTGALWAAVFTAFSPGLVFYARYYIHETLLVLFSFAAMALLWYIAIPAGAGREHSSARRFDRATIFRLLLLGLCLGLMHATKETWILPLAAMGVGAVVLVGIPPRRSWPGILFGLLLVVLAALVVSAVFYSSFFRYPRGILDSFSAYLHYFRRAAGAEAALAHPAPWHEYLRRMFFWTTGSGYVWPEAATGVFALVGIAAAWLPGKAARWKGPARFLSIYTVLLLLGYSAIAYKTPWCALGIIHGLCLLAGLGAQALWQWAKPVAGKVAVGAALALAVGYSAREAARFSLFAYGDAECPFSYAQTSGDVLPLTRRLHEIACTDSGKQWPVQVICPNHDYWPLPWYLRHLDQVGWFDGPPTGKPAPLLVVHTSAETAVIDWLYHRQPPGERYAYVSLPRSHLQRSASSPTEPDSRWELRPGVWFRIYVRLALWQQLGDGTPP